MSTFSPTGQDVLALYERVDKLVESRCSRAIYEDLQPFYVAARDYKFASLKHNTGGDQADDDEHGAAGVHLQAAIQHYPRALAALERGEATARAAAQVSDAQGAPDSPTATNGAAGTADAPSDGGGAPSRQVAPIRACVPSEPLPPGVSVRMVDIGDIVIPPNRKPDPDLVRWLVESIRDVGLLHPIIVTPSGDLVAGRNRVAAYVELGRSQIEARIEMLGKLDRELIEIDENLIRRRFTVLERGRLLLRRKELYEMLHPEARQHARGGHAKALAQAATETISVAPAFASDAASKLGTSERTVREEIRIAKELAAEAAELIQGTALADETVKLMEITRLPPGEQLTVVRALVEGRAKSVKAAVAQLKAATNPSGPEPDRRDDGDGGEEADGGDENAQQGAEAGGTDTATDAIQRHRPASMPAPLTQEEELPGRRRGAVEHHDADWLCVDRLWKRARLPALHLEALAGEDGADINDEDLVSIPGALAEVRDKLRRSKPGAMKADLVSTVRELLAQIDRALKPHEEAGVDDHGLHRPLPVIDHLEQAPVDEEAPSAPGVEDAGFPVEPPRAAAQHGDHQDDETPAACQPQPASAQPASTIKNGFIQQVEELWNRDLEEPARRLDTEAVRLLKETYFSVIKESYKAARGELSRLRRKRNEREAIRNLVSADQFQAACDTLAITIRFGGDVDLNEVRRKAARTAAFFHPDKGPDPTGARMERYRLVIQAREVLEKYQDERTKR